LIVGAVKVSLYRPLYVFFKIGINEDFAIGSFGAALGMEIRQCLLNREKDRRGLGWTDRLALAGCIAEYPLLLV
jgi:hypothetical protein